MILKLRLFLICAGILLNGAEAYSAQTEKSRGNAVSILIDVSGSMKQNDPDNRRISAVKLLINLLPDDTKAGIWLFAENTKLLIKTTKVNAGWKKKALSAIKKIHSRGLYTHIEDAIQTTLREGFAQSDGKNLILLTDGMVDTSQDIMQSADSRERIIADLIPVLQQQQIRVHTIALSDNADKELLEKLAFDTNGWTESPQSAEQLQKTFLKMFNKALPQDGVPLNNNTFTIDSSIKEFSVLVFKKSGAAQTQLIRPDKQKLSSKTNEDKISWIQDEYYDLITIQQPAAGEWMIEAEMDPDNQVMIMTDLKLNINDLPDYIAEQETVDVQSHFTEQGQLIKRYDFLELVDISLQQTDDLNRKSTWKMAAPTNKAGYFSQTIGETLGKGRHTLKIIADGKTFQREIVRTIEVAKVAVKVNKSFDPESKMITLELLPDREIIDADMMTARADVKRAAKELETIEIKIHEGHWLLSLETPEQGEKIIVNFSIMAKTVRGEPVTPNIKPVIIDEQFIDQIKTPIEVESEVAKPDSEQQEANPVLNKNDTDEKPTEVNEEVSDETAVEKESVWVVIAGVVVINILLITSGFFGYKYMKKRKTTEQEQLLERLT